MLHFQAAPFVHVTTFSNFFLDIGLSSLSFYYDDSGGEPENWITDKLQDVVKKVSKSAHDARIRETFEAAAI